MLRFTIGLCVLMACSQAAAYNFVCDHGDTLLGGGRVEFPYDEWDDEVRAKFVFVSFSAAGYPTTISYEQHGVFLELMNDYLDKQSYGKLRFHPDSGILLYPDEEELSPMNPDAEAWDAELTPNAYRQDVVPGWDHPDLQDWLIGLPHHASELYAEILSEIHDAYIGHPSPFPDVPAGERGWELYFCFLINGPGEPGWPLNSVFDQWIDGRPDIHVIADRVIEDTGDFYLNIEAGQYNPASFAGTGQMVAAQGGIDWPPRTEASLLYVIHEFIHTLGPSDGPPGLQTNPEYEETYYFGNLNMLDQHVEYLDCWGLDAGGISDGPEFYGFPPIGDFWLETLPWNKPAPEDSVVVSFSDRCLFREKIYEVATGGQLYRADVDYYPNKGPEYFLVAYHGGGGVEDQGYESPAVPGRGLAIWHCVGEHNMYAMVDLEVSTGLFDYTQETIYQEPWLVSVYPDTQGGYDGYDPWLGRDGDDFCEYLGSEGDFFRIDHSQPEYNHDLFSWNTNPNCFGYSRESPHPVLRRRPQDVPNTIVVKIYETGVDPGPDGRAYMIVDLLHAPAERLVAPDLSLGVTADVPVDLVLATDHPDGITTVDVFYSNTGGELGWYWQIANAVLFDPADPVISWTPTAAQWSDVGKLRFEFVNSIRDDRIGYYETENFAFNGPGTFTVYENIVAPQPGDLLYESYPAEIRWTNFFLDNYGIELDRVDVDYDLDGDEIWRPWQSFHAGGAQTWTIDHQTGESVALAAPIAGMVGPQVRLRLTFDNDGQQATMMMDGTLAVYPTEFGFAEEDSLLVGVDYVGRPHGTAVVRYDGDDRPDLFVTVEDDLGHGVAARSEYYHNEFQGSGLRFLDRTGQVFYNPDIPGVGFRGIAAADCDKDGDIEIFLTHESTPAYYERFGDGYLHNVIGDLAYFDAEAFARADSSVCATWIDANHDGYLDLHIGRKAMLYPVRDAILLQADDGSTPKFRESSEATGFGMLSPVASHTIAWGDFDQDNLWDVMIGCPGLQKLRYLRETSPGVYEVETAVPVVGGNSYQPAGFLEWLDLDRDGDLDLVTIAVQNVHFFETTAAGLANESQISITGQGTDGGQGADLDLDGWPELTLNGQGTSAAPALVMMNTVARTDFPEMLLPTSAAVGLDDAHGKSFALATADFDGDGDLDLILGRDGLAGRVKRAIQTDGSEAPANNWLGIHLDGRAEDNTMGIGATITLSDPIGGSPLGCQVVPGGGGRGGQPCADRIFGLGNHAGNVQVGIRWPLGLYQEFLVEAEYLNSMITILQTIGCSLDDSSVKPTIIFHPSGDVEWLFRWSTDRWTMTEHDKVTITRVQGSDCGFEQITLEMGSGPKVEVKPVRYSVDPQTREVSYRHEIRWLEQPCHLGCFYTFFVVSWDGRFTGTAVSSDDHRVEFRACPGL